MFSLFIFAAVPYVPAIPLRDTPPLPGGPVPILTVVDPQGVQAPAEKLLEKIKETDDRFPGGTEPLWREMEQVPAPVHATALLDVLFEKRDWRDQGRLKRTLWLSVQHWPRTLVDRARALPGFPGAGANVEEWRPRLLSLHMAYVRSLVSGYCFLEALKRQYLIDDAPARLSGSEREELIARAKGIHDALQRLMRTFHSLRKAPDLAELMPYNTRVLMGKTWEEVYGEAFHFGLTMNADASRAYAKRDLVQYFGPFLPATPPSPGGGVATALAAALHEYREVARLLMDPAKKDDPALKERLRVAVEKLKKLGVDLNPSTHIPPVPGIGPTGPSDQPPPMNNPPPVRPS